MYFPALLQISVCEQHERFFGEAATQYQFVVDLPGQFDGLVIIFERFLVIAHEKVQVPQGIHGFGDPLSVAEFYTGGVCFFQMGHGFFKLAHDAVQFTEERMGDSDALWVAQFFSQFEVFEEKDVDKLIEKLKSADLVVGFNHVKFDYRVLSAYSPFDLRSLPNFDILADVRKRLGHRLSLEQLVSNTLKAPKLADGLQSLQWWKEGKIDKIIEYCTSDVQLTRDLFEFGLREGYLLFNKKNEGVVRLPVDWKLKDIVKRASKNR